MSDKKLESAEQLGARYYATVDEEQPTQSMRELAKLAHTDREAVLEWVADQLDRADAIASIKYSAFIRSLKHELPR